MKVLQQFEVFTPLGGSIEPLHSIATTDVATYEIQETLPSVEEELGQSKLGIFVKGERLVNSTVKVRDQVQKSNPLTFKSLYEVRNRNPKRKVTTLKADRTILQRLITSLQACRKVDRYIDKCTKSGPAKTDQGKLVLSGRESMTEQYHSLRTGMISQLFLPINRTLYFYFPTKRLPKQGDVTLHSC